MGSLSWELRVLASRFTHQIRYAVLSPIYYRNPLAMLSANVRDRRSILRLRDGAVFEVRPRTTDRAAANDIFINRPYTDDGRFQIRHDDTVVDAGANIGAFTVFAARRCRRVIAIEPIPDHFSALQRNVALNGLTNVMLCRAALAKSDGRIDIAGDGMSASTVWGAHSRCVDAITLTTLLDNHSIDRVNFLKMDIEGAEFDVLMNTPRSTLDRIDRIVLEFHTVERGTRDAPTLATCLRAAGFLVAHTTGSWNGMLKALREKRSQNE